jgi:hypothetical protein
MGMEGGRDRRQVREAAIVAQAQHVGEGAAVTHAGQQLAVHVDVPLAGHLLDHGVDAGAVDIGIHR